MRFAPRSTLRTLLIAALVCGIALISVLPALGMASNSPAFEVAPDVAQPALGFTVTPPTLAVGGTTTVDITLTGNVKEVTDAGVTQLPVYRVSKGNATGGTFTLTISTASGDATTATIVPTANAGVVKSEVDAVVDPDTTSVTGDPGGPWVITFAVAPAWVSIDSTALTPAPVTGASVVIVPVYTVSVGSATGGDFTLTVGAKTTTRLAYDVSAANFQAALTAQSISAVVTGSGPWVITFAVAPGWVTIDPYGEPDGDPLGLTQAILVRGFQFQVNYDPAVLSTSTANASFVESGFNLIPPEWNHVCADGVCKFAAAKSTAVSPLDPSVILARITFTALARGSVNLSFGDNLLSDPSGYPIDHTAGTATVAVQARSATGKVVLQGFLGVVDDVRDTVTLSCTIATVGLPMYAPIDGAGNWSMADVPPCTGTYSLVATYPLYLSSTKSPIAPADIPLSANATVVATTTLLGGNADANAQIDITDATCVGGAFGGGPTLCNGSGSTDVNYDGVVNILDLSLVGGNFGATTSVWP